MLPSPAPEPLEVLLVPAPEPLEVLVVPTLEIVVVEAPCAAPRLLALLALSALLALLAAHACRRAPAAVEVAKAPPSP